MKRQAELLTADNPNMLLVCAQTPYLRLDYDAYMEELINLAKSNGLTDFHTMHIKLREIDSANFFTKGKLIELKDMVTQHEIDEVVISEPLSPQQERNLRDFLHCKVFDRAQLILEIFEKSAHTAEGKTEVAIAMLQHKKTRAAGKGVHFAQQRGVFGMRAGAGETAKEKELRSIEETILTLKRNLRRMEETRATQRKRRLVRGEPLICLVGYTNAGKSTILNALTKSNVLAEDRLFATLDTTTRELYVNAQKKGLISDTVGFIQQLPPKLIEAFKSTLSELQYADLLAHVVDLGNKNWPDHIKVVNEVLHDLKLDEKKMLYIFNKVDRVADVEQLKTLIEPYQPHVLVSSLSKEGLKPLLDFLATWKK
jgi:GTP-binding protein HflX